MHTINCADNSDLNFLIGRLFVIKYCNRCATLILGHEFNIPDISLYEVVNQHLYNGNMVRNAWQKVRTKL